MLAVQENFGHVAECACGTIHLAIGPVSVALDSNALRRLLEMVGAAIHKADSNEIAESESVFSHSSHLALSKVMKLKH
jgi:hypothetical protein